VGSKLRSCNFFAPRWFTCPQAVTHRSTNRARRRVTSLKPKRVTNYATPPGRHKKNIFQQTKGNCLALYPAAWRQCWEIFTQSKQQALSSLCMERSSIKASCCLTDGPTVNQSERRSELPTAIRLSVCSLSLSRILHEHKPIQHCTLRGKHNNQLGHKNKKFELMLTGRAKAYSSSYPQAVTHRSTNGAQRRVTSFQPKRVTSYATPPKPVPWRRLVNDIDLSRPKAPKNP